MSTKLNLTLQVLKFNVTRMEHPCCKHFVCLGQGGEENFFILLGLGKM